MLFWKRKRETEKRLVSTLSAIQRKNGLISIQSGLLKTYEGALEIKARVQQI
jgi:hypothetical protein